MAITKEKLPQANTQDSPKRVTNSPRPSGVAGTPISSRPSGVSGVSAISSHPSGADGRSAVSSDSFLSEDEMGYGRIVKTIKAIQK